MNAAAQAPAPVAPAYTIRAALPEDEGFVANAWAETFRGNPAERRIEPGFFNRCIYPRLRAIMQRSAIRVAVAPKDGLVIYGFAVMEPGLIHMVYVRRAWRRLGIARALLDGISIEDSDWSTQSSDFREWIRHKWNMRNYRPFWADERDVYG